MGKLYFLFFCLFCVCTGNISNAQTDTGTINQLFNKNHNFTNPDSAIKYNDSLLQLSIQANFPDGAFKALIAKSIKYFEKENYGQERNCSIEALPWAAKSSIKDATAWCLNNIGLSYLNEGDYIQASLYYYKALEELKKIHGPPTHTHANVYNNLGLVNIRLNQPTKAFAYFRQAEDVCRKENLDFQLANALANEGECYNIAHLPDSAVKCFNEVMEIGKKLNKTDIRAQAYDELGKTFITTGEYQKAIPKLQMAIALAHNTYPYIVVDASLSLGDALSHTGKYIEAEAILEAALKETRDHNFKDNYVDCYSKLITAYKASGQYKKALDYTDSLNILRDSLISSEKVRVINQMEIKYESAEKDKQLAQSQLLIAQQRGKLINKNIWIVSIAVGIFLLVMVIAVIINRTRHKQTLQAEQIKSLQQENTISILKGAVQGEEKERSRIARELHDGIGGMLSASMMRLMSIRHENKEISSVPAYNEALALLDEMGDEIRKTAHNLMPEVLLKQSLPEAISNYCNYLQQHNAMQIDFQSYGSFDNIAQKNKLNIYRIVQELLKNITQHAKATHALVQLLINEHTLTIIVEDNGSGFNINDIKYGIGLYSLQTRVSTMDGHYTLDPEPGKGTSVYIEFDIQKMITDDAV